MIFLNYRANDYGIVVKKQICISDNLIDSFNLHGYPNVCTPEQAIWTLDNSGLDGVGCWELFDIEVNGLL